MSSPRGARGAKRLDSLRVNASTRRRIRSRSAQSSHEYRVQGLRRRSRVAGRRVGSYNMTGAARRRAQIPSKLDATVAEGNKLLLFTELIGHGEDFTDSPRFVNPLALVRGQRDGPRHTRRKVHAHPAPDGIRPAAKRNLMTSGEDDVDAQTWFAESRRLLDDRRLLRHRSAAMRREGTAAGVHPNRRARSRLEGGGHLLWRYGDASDDGLTPDPSRGGESPRSNRRRLSAYAGQRRDRRRRATAVEATARRSTSAPRARRADCPDISNHCSVRHAGPGRHGAVRRRRTAGPTES